MDRYRKGFSNRFIPIEVPVIRNNKKEKITMRFKGRIYKGKFINVEDIDDTQSPLIERDLTWCDVFYRAAVEVSKDKHILVTRFPIDSYFNIFPSKVLVSSTKQTEPMLINDVLYGKYPRIRQEDIGSNTSNKFVDTIQFSNLQLEPIGGDYDGDQVHIRGVYTVEANEECDKYLNSKSQYITLMGTNVRVQGKETIQSLYCLTKVNPKDKLINPVF